jgi:hypothetical protein
MCRSYGSMPNLQYGIRKRRICYTRMPQRQVYEKVEIASIRSCRIFSRAPNETEKIKRRTWTLLETGLRRKIQAKQLIQSRLGNDYSKC